jgi:rare lipoprotein A
MTAMRDRSWPVVPACALLLLLASCSRLPRRAGNGPVLAPGDAVAGEVFASGVASWYGGDFQGRLTADGEVYDMHKLTAAHPQLPFHTIVEVESLDTGRRVLVRINDRGPFLKDRIIDLSFAAATRLGMVERGTADVRLRLVRRGAGGAVPGPAGEPGPIAGAPFPSGPDAAGYVQAGAFSLRANAEELQLTLADLFPDLVFRVTEEEGLFKVISPRLEADACRELLRRMQERGLPGFVRAADAPGG